MRQPDATARSARARPLILVAVVAVAACEGGTGSGGNDAAGTVPATAPAVAEANPGTDATDDATADAITDTTTDAIADTSADATVDTTADAAADTIAIGAVRTLEIDGRVLSSLPAAAPAVDPAEAELGRLLFWDPILSGDRDVACATCHLPELGYSDGQAQAIGVGGAGRGADRVVGHTGFTPRNAQGLLNVAWNGIGELGIFDPLTAPMFHDNRVAGLVAQAREPIRSREEMRGEAIAADAIDVEIVSRVDAVADYAVAFESVYGAGPVTLDRIGAALGAFQTTLAANDAPFDRWMRGERDAMTAAELDGMEEFVAAGCADCHSGPMFSDFDTHVLGIEDGTVRDEGDGQFGFRTPTLRQLRFTAPYFHAGQRATLGDVIDFYDQPRRSRNAAVPDDALDPELLDVPAMNRGRGDAILRFLETLNDPNFDRQEPASVPSGLPVGGSLTR